MLIWSPKCIFKSSVNVRLLCLNECNTIYLLCCSQNIDESATRAKTTMIAVGPPSHSSIKTSLWCHNCGWVFLVPSSSSSSLFRLCGWVIVTLRTANKTPKTPDRHTHVGKTDEHELVGIPRASVVRGVFSRIVWCRWRGTKGLVFMLLFTMRRSVMLFVLTRIDTYSCLSVDFKFV